MDANSMRGCLGIGGLLLAAGSVAMLAALVSQAPDEGLASDPGALVGSGLLVVTLIAGLVTMWYIYGSSDEREQPEADDLEGEILHAVREDDGRMTGAGLADATGLEVEEATSILERLADDDYIRVESDSGDDVYVFPDSDDLEEHELIAKLGNLLEFDESSEKRDG